MAKREHLWSIVKDGEKVSIRRWENGKFKRLPVKKYGRLRGNLEELRAFVSRLNYQIEKERATRDAVNFKHAFISPAMMDDYHDFLLSQVPNEGNAIREYNATVKHCLNYFVGSLNLSDPLEWHKVHKTKWAAYLTKLELAPTTLRGFIQGANRFLRWLHERRPAEAPPLVLAPLSRAALRQLTATYRLDNPEERRFVTEEEWLALKLPDSIRAAATFCYIYGLRRSEALALKPQDVRSGYLSVERQLVSLTDTAATKGKDLRKTPHWFGTAKDSAKLVKQIVLMHPDTFGELFVKATEGAFTLHSLRHTFISRAVRSQNIRDVMLAVGHKNIETTMGYLKDDRTLDDAIVLD